MPVNLLETFIDEYMDLFDGRLIFIWHGGEPLLAGLDFFKLVVRLQQQHVRNDQKLHSTLQTNGTLVTDEWAAFFAEHDFRIGVSIDGGPRSHDHFRRNFGGRGSFDGVRRGIEMLRRHGLEPGIIQTLTRDNLPRAAEDLSFFTDILKLRGWGTNTYLDVEGITTAESIRVIAFRTVMSCSLGISHANPYAPYSTAQHVWNTPCGSILCTRIVRYVNGRPHVTTVVLCIGSVASPASISIVKRERKCLRIFATRWKSSGG
jgi:sulfatase maturation enzyme AslB (radical SAM superfamily)